MAIADVRAELMAVFAGISATMYDYVPPVVSTPALFIFPDDPYLEVKTIGRSAVTVSAKFRLVAAVANLDNKAALANLETLMIEAVAALPSGWLAEAWDKPSLDTIGPSDLLIATLPISKITTQGD